MESASGLARIVCAITAIRRKGVGGNHAPPAQGCVIGPGLLSGAGRAGLVPPDRRRIPISGTHLDNGINDFERNAMIS
jgi:hypothetical protein